MQRGEGKRCKNDMAIDDFIISTGLPLSLQWIIIQSDASMTNQKRIVLQIRINVVNVLMKSETLWFKWYYKLILQVRLRHLTPEFVSANFCHPHSKAEIDEGCAEVIDVSPPLWKLTKRINTDYIHPIHISTKWLTNPKGKP